jgi:CheY-like chemotaxis protein
MTDFQSVDILLVEDSSTDAELTRRALRKHCPGDRVHWVQDGVEALDYLFCAGAYAGRAPGSAPRLVLLDLKLPRLDGTDVLRALKTDARTQAIPVVVLSSSAEGRDLADSYRLGANSYIVKPVEYEAFAEVVAQANHYWLRVNRTPRSP